MPIKEKKRKTGLRSLLIALGLIAACAGIAALLPAGWKGFAALLYFASLIAWSVASNFKKALRSQEPGPIAPARLDSGLPAQQAVAAPAAEREIFLIRTFVTKRSEAYEAFAKDGKLFFCRIGWKLRGIKRKAGIGPDESAEALLADKYNFAVPVEDIQAVEMRPKKRRAYGSDIGNGSIRIRANGQTIKFLVHTVQSFEAAEGFFRESCHTEPKAVGRASPPIDVGDNDKAVKFNKTRIRRIVLTLDGAALLLFFWLILLPVPYEAAILLALAFPPAGLCLYARYGRAFSFSEGRATRPNALDIVLFPSMGLFTRFLLDFNIVWSAGLVAAALVLAAGACLFVFSMNREYRLKRWIAFVLPVILILYSLGGIVTTNCVFDASMPVKYPAVVVHKAVNESKYYTTYKLTLSQWGQQSGQSDANVPKELYAATEVNDTVYVYDMQGLWGIEWYELAGCAR